MARLARSVDYETPKIDRWGRICIPERYRELLKLRPGDSVALIRDPAFEGLVLTPLDIKGRR